MSAPPLTPALSPALSKDTELHYLALRLVPGLGPLRTVRLLEHFKTPERLFRASPSEIEAQGISPGVARSIASGCTFDDAADQHQKMIEHGVTLVPFPDPRYPALLRDIYDPPPVLFLQGDASLLAGVSVGVVGTRRPTPYGVAAAERLAAEIAAEGVVIASGMARGIDTAAHRAALKVRGKTLAVFGSGVDHIYPAENRKLAAEIAAKGLLVSEFPMGTPAHPQNFPIRNRIVSGLSAGVLVVEGAQYSGSGITAKLAMEQGKTVFAVPGNITSKMSWGPNLLIKMGAKLVQDAADIVSELPLESRRQLAAAAGPNQDSTANSLEQLELQLGGNVAVAKSVLSCLKIEEVTPLDVLLDSLENCSSSETIAALFELEMFGLVRQLPGKNFVKVW